MNYLRSLLIKVLQAGDSGASLTEKAEYFGKAGAPIGVLTFIFGTMSSWYMDNQGFTIAVAFFVGLNALVGGFMHWIKLLDFDWGELLLKTSRMILVIGLTYFVLEAMITIAGEGMIINGFRASVQVATLLYPGMKLIKASFILSNGEHPPKWLMEKLYNFNKNGDLRQFLSAAHEGNNEDDINMTPNGNENID